MQRAAMTCVETASLQPLVFWRTVASFRGVVDRDERLEVETDSGKAVCGLHAIGGHCCSWMIMIHQ